MSAVQVSFAEFALAVQAAIDCAPPVTQAAPVVVAHPLAADGGECSYWGGPVGDWVSLYNFYRVYRDFVGGPLPSAGSFVLLELALLADALERGSNSDRVASFDRLVFHAQYAIGAGC